jgi:phage tail sheath protein FI
MNTGTALPKEKNAAVYFPRLKQANPLREGQIETFVPCGTVAGIIARTDATRGVWKAPAGLQANLAGVNALAVPLTDAENGELNPLGVNCIRTFAAAGHVIWGSRTLMGDDRLASEWKYIPVRRVTLYIEESLYRGTQWAVFEPNDEPLWAQLRLAVGSFMNSLFRQGAFQGSTPSDAYFVRCDSTTTTQADIDRGIVNVMVGFAPLKPAEFVILYIQQKAGDIAV